jgi:hypothetical protein
MFTNLMVQLVFASLLQADSADAKQALKSVQEAVDKNKDVRIMNASGVDTTQTNLGKSASPAGTDDPEESIVQVARQASDLRMKGSPKAMSSQTRPAMILTEDRLMRVRAARDKVAAIAPSMFKKILTAGTRRRSSASEASVDGSRQPGSPLGLDQ